jgi:hypothetical protein
MFKKTRVLWRLNWAFTDALIGNGSKSRRDFHLFFGAGCEITNLYLENYCDIYRARTADEIAAMCMADICGSSEQKWGQYHPITELYRTVFLTLAKKAWWKSSPEDYMTLLQENSAYYRDTHQSISEHLKAPGKRGENLKDLVEVKDSHPVLRNISQKQRN